MQTGPSKEELKDYWKNSRPYFDELAKYYRESDPQYYNEYIAPFYSNPFYAISSGKKSPLTAVVVLAILILGVVAGAVFFILQSEKDTDTEREVTTKKEKTIPAPEKKVIPPAPFEGGTEKADSSYKAGLRYFEAGDYDNAEKYFRKVKSSDENYKNSRKKLNMIMVIKKKKMEEELNKRQRPVQPRINTN